MKKKILLLEIALLSLTALSCSTGDSFSSDINLSSENQSSENDSTSISDESIYEVDDEYTFIFHYDNDQQDTSVIIKQSELTSYVLPIAQKNHCEFIGWFFDELFTEEYDYLHIFEKVDKLVNLYAKYEPKQYTLTVHDNPVQKYYYNYEDPIVIDGPEKNNDCFVGYYLDAKFENPFTLYKMPDNDLDVYLRFIDHNWVSNINDESHIFCNRCGKRSFPIIEINTNESIVKEQYATTKVSVKSGEVDYDISEADCKVKIRGNGTSNHPKKPYRLKFEKKQKMLGLNNDLKAKSWVLLAEYFGYLVKNMVAFDFAKVIMGDYYSSDYAFVQLFINGEDQGVYLLAEQNQVGEGRIDINEPDKNYTGVDIGYLVEMDMYYATEDYYFSVDYNNGLESQSGEFCEKNELNKYYSIKSDIYSDDQLAYIQKVISNTYYVIYDTLHCDHDNLMINPYLKLDDDFEIVPDPSIPTQKKAIENVIDYDSFKRMFLLHEILQDYDIGWSSFYLSIDCSSGGNKKLTFECPWDFDLSLGYNDVYQDSLYALSKYETTYSLINPWFMVFAKCDWFIDEALEMWLDISSSKMIENEIDKVKFFVIDNFTTLYDNYAKWPRSMDNFSAYTWVFSEEYNKGINRVIDFLIGKKAVLDQMAGS